VRNRGIESDFLRCLHMLKPEVVHFQHVQGVSARLIVLAAGRPRIATLHDYWYFCANSQLVRPDRFVCADPRLGYDCVDCATVRADLAPLRRLRPLMAQPFLWRNRYLHRLLAQMDLLITPSRFLRDQYRRFLGPKLPPILVSENGLDLDRLALREVALPSPPARPHFGFLGSIAWQKGVHVLIEAFNRVRGGSLTIYGDESIFPAYAAEVR
ncbi:MAG: glycosyltransferase, partial [Chloroflexi bacterium]|nr:glycosyltransferase [Chloroflexota bacterium]